MKKGMIKVSVLYPNGEGKNFDMDYYCNQHVQLVGAVSYTHLTLPTTPYV